MDGFNLEQLVDDEPIHMVFKSLSVSPAINLQDTLDLSSYFDWQLQCGIKKIIIAVK